MGGVKRKNINSSKKTSSKTKKIKKNTKKIVASQLSSDELYEQLKLKKTNKKNKYKKSVISKKKKEEKKYLANNYDVENEIVKKILSGEYKFFDDIQVEEENVEDTRDLSEVVETLNNSLKTEVKKKEIKIEKPKKEKIEVVKKDEDINNEKLLQDIKEAVKEDKKKQDEMIITREIDLSEITNIVKENENKKELDDIETIINLGKREKHKLFYKIIDYISDKKKAKEESKNKDIIVSNESKDISIDDKIENKSKEKQKIIEEKSNLEDKKVDVNKIEKKDDSKEKELSIKPKEDSNNAKKSLDKKIKVEDDNVSKKKEKSKKESNKVGILNKWNKRFRELVKEYESNSKKNTIEKNSIKKRKKDLIKNKGKTNKREDSKLRDNVKNKVLLLFFIFFIVCLVLAFSSIKYINSKDNVTYALDENDIDDSNKKIEYDPRYDLYDECLEQPLNEMDTSEEITNYINELNSYLGSNYRTSIIYEDLTTGFRYEYNIEKSYYAASTIKMLDALYFYTKASNGEISLDDTITYNAKYRVSYSSGMDKHKYGEKISIRTLISYAVLYSDNTAHTMLMNYAGVSNIRAFALSLGAKSADMYGNELYGNLTAYDASIYVKTLNEFINNNSQYGEEVKQLFINSDDDYLSMPELGIKAAHKYGQYSPYYHQIGIVYDENPYIVTILTSNYNRNIENTIKDIHSRIYKLHRMYNDNRDNQCYLKYFSN